MAAGKDRMLDQKGMIYFTALAVMVILTGLGLAYLYVARTETMASANELRSLKSFYLAEAGVEHAMARLLYDGASYPPGGGEYTIVDYVNLPPVYGDAEASYRAYMPDAKTIVGQSSTGGAASREVQVKINNSGIPDAILTGYRLDFGTPPDPTTVATINGNAEVGYFQPVYLPTTIVYGRTPWYGYVIDSIIPEPNLSSYASNAEITYPQGDVTWDASPPALSGTGTGIRYITGNLYIDGPGPITVDGSIVVAPIPGQEDFTGNVFLGYGTPLSTSLTVTPFAGYPAVIAANSMLAQPAFIPYADLTFNGLVWVKNEISLIGFNEMRVHGALVQKTVPSPAAADLRLWGNTLKVDYNPDLSAPYFSGSTVGKPAIVSWQAHHDNGV